MDKWQQREAQQLAADEGVTVDDAAARLFPPARAARTKTPAKTPLEKTPVTKSE